MRISIVIPLFNEGQHFADSFATIGEAIADCECEFEWVLVDDGSTDDTWHVIQALYATDAQVHGLRFSRNFGKEVAIVAGMERAIGDAVIVMDGDLQHPPNLIPQMIEKWRAGFEIVEGIKSSRGHESLFKRGLAHAYYSLMSRLSGFDLRQASDFKLLGREAVEAFLSLRERAVFFRGMSAWVGFERAALTFDVGERLHGASKWSMFQLVRLALSSVMSFSAAPLQIVSLFGVIAMMLGTFLGAKALYDKVTGAALGGFTTVILVQLFIGGMILVGMGILGKYLGVMLEEVKRRPRYIVGRRLAPKNQIDSALRRPLLDRSVQKPLH